MPLSADKVALVPPFVEAESCMVIAGVQKSGTTSLHRYLSRYEEIFIPDEPQEICFFREEEYDRVIDSYINLFAGWDGEPIIGQTCPVYITSPDVPRRLSNHLPDARLVFILRDPVERAYSHYWHNVRKGREEHTFEEALDIENDRTNRSSYHNLHYCYLDRSRYNRHLTQFLRFFSRDQMCFVLTEDLSYSGGDPILSLCDHIGIQHDPEIQLGLENRSRLAWLPSARSLIRQLEASWGWLGRWLDQINRTRPYPEINPETRRMLVSRLRSDIEELESLIDRDLSQWKT